MTTSIASHASPSLELNIAQRGIRKSLFARLAQMQNSAVDVHESGLRSRLGADCAEQAVDLQVHNPQFYTDVFTEGTLGVARSWIEGHWSSDDLSALLRIALREPELFQGLDGRLAKAASVLRRCIAALDRNTRTGSRRNIAAHYDIGNDLFERMLDSTLTYSSAIFPSPDASLEAAQFEKYDRICRRLDLQPHHNVLEIGTGWGGFALHAARNYGCHITTTTISKEQHVLARERFDADPARDRIKLLSQDYRDVTGSYDRLVSIEMIEAVGDSFYEEYFRACSNRLKEDGAMSIQAIVIEDQSFESSAKHVDFIKKYIFPGGCIPSITRIVNGMTSATDLRLHHLEDITPHYAETLRRWRIQFDAAEPELLAAGYTEEFMRMWRYYLSYCEAGFEERHTACVQLDFVKPMWRPSS